MTVADDALLGEARALRAEIERDRHRNQVHWRNAGEALARAVEDQEQFVARTESRGLKTTLVLLILQLSAATAEIVRVFVTGDLDSLRSLSEWGGIVSSGLLLLTSGLLISVAAAFATLRRSTRATADLTLRLRAQAVAEELERRRDDDPEHPLPASAR